MECRITDEIVHNPHEDHKEKIDPYDIEPEYEISVDPLEKLNQGERGSPHVISDSQIERLEDLNISLIQLDCPKGVIDYLSELINEIKGNKNE